MKKKLFILLVAAMCILTTSCGTNNTTRQVKKSIENYLIENDKEMEIYCLPIGKYEVDSVDYYDFTEFHRCPSIYELKTLEANCMINLKIDTVKHKEYVKKYRTVVRGYYYTWTESVPYYEESVIDKYFAIVTPTNMCIDYQKIRRKYADKHEAQWSILYGDADIKNDLIDTTIYPEDKLFKKHKNESKNRLTLPVTDTSNVSQEPQTDYEKEKATTHYDSIMFIPKYSVSIYKVKNVQMIDDYNIQCDVIFEVKDATCMGRIECYRNGKRFKKSYALHYTCDKGWCVKKELD